MITVYNDRPQSGGVMSQGQILLLIHRFSTEDDDRGVEEPIYEVSSASKYFRVRHVLTFSNNINQNYFENLYQNKPILVSLGNNTVNTNYNNNKRTISYDSIISKLIDHTPNIVVNFHIKTPTNADSNKKEVYIQLYKLADAYFENTSTEQSFKFNNIDGLDYTLTEYAFNSVQPIKSSLRNNFLTLLFEDTCNMKDSAMILKAQDFSISY